MFLLFPKKVRVVTAMTPKQCHEKLNRDMEEYTRKPSLVAASSFIKAHKLDSCYFGSAFNKDGTLKTEIFYHRAKKHDGSSAGFFGTITKREDGEKGSVIEGSIRRTLSTYIAAVTWTLFTLCLLGILLLVKVYTGAAVTAGVMLAGLGLIAYDRSAAFVKSYLEGFSKQSSE